MIKLFCGYDPREAVGFHTFVASAIAHTSAPLAITPLGGRGLPEGSNAFTTSRFLVPWLSFHEGWAVFADACDMLLLADLRELLLHVDPSKAVLVVKHAYRTRNPRKYLGTGMECDNLDYERKNWASLMLINCAHRAWARLTPESIGSARPIDLLQLRHLDDADIGELPDEWNRIVDEGQPVEGAKLLHWTAGIPAFPLYRNAPGAEHWHLRRGCAMGGAA